MLPGTTTVKLLPAVIHLWTITSNTLYTDTQCIIVMYTNYIKDEKYVNISHDSWWLHTPFTLHVTRSRKPYDNNSFRTGPQSIFFYNDGLKYDQMSTKLTKKHWYWYLPLCLDFLVTISFSALLGAGACFLAAACESFALRNTTKRVMRNPYAK